MHNFMLRVSAVPWLLEQEVQNVGCIRVLLEHSNLMRFHTEVIIFETVLLSMWYIRFLLANSWKIHKVRSEFNPIYCQT